MRATSTSILAAALGLASATCVVANPYLDICGNGVPEAEKNCEKWTNDTTEARGVWGRLTATDGKWTNHSDVECWNYARLICIEQ